MLQEWIPGDMSKTVLIDGFIDRDGTVTTMVARRRVRMDPPKLANTSSDVTIPLDQVREAVAVNAPASRRRGLPRHLQRRVQVRRARWTVQDHRGQPPSVLARRPHRAGRAGPPVDELPRRAGAPAARTGRRTSSGATGCTRSSTRPRCSGPGALAAARRDRSCGPGSWATARCSGGATRLPGIADMSQSLGRAAGRNGRPVPARVGTRRPKPGYLIAIGFTGEPTPPVIGSGTAVSRNS